MFALSPVLVQLSHDIRLPLLSKNVRQGLLTDAFPDSSEKAEEGEALRGDGVVFRGMVDPRLGFSESDL